MATTFATVTVEAPITDAVPETCAGQAEHHHHPTQWEAFPQPAGWSAEWDFEELDRAPRPNNRNGALVAQSQTPDPASDEA
jgi:hypothetical protein